MSSTSRLLSLPVELRLEIYAYAISGAPVYTIGSTRFIASDAELERAKHEPGQSPTYGHVPVILDAYSRAILAGDHGYTKEFIDDQALHAVSAMNQHCSWTALSLTCRRINIELRTKAPKSLVGPCDLFIAFPYGLHVLRNYCPHLLRHATTVHIAGVCDTMAISRSRRDRNQYPATTGRHLSKVIEKVMRNEPDNTANTESLEMRIYFPGENSYSAIWQEGSPISMALGSIGAAQVDMVISRGRYGTGIHLKATKTTGLKNVSTTWRELYEAGPYEPQSWFIDDVWNKRKA